MARRRRRARRTLKANPRRRRRAVRANPKRRRRLRRNPRRRARRLRANPVRRRRARANPRRRSRRNPRRRLRRNGPTDQIRAIEMGLASKPRRRRARRASRKVRGARRRKLRTKRRLLGTVRRLRRRVKRLPRRSLRRTVARVQLARAVGSRRVFLRRGAKAMRHSAIARAMHIKTNPGMEGLINVAKTLAPQIGVGALGLVGLAMGGAKVSSLIRDKLPASIQPYAPALSTAALSVVAYIALDKIAPKYKGFVAVGGLFAAVIQAIVAASGMNPDPNSIVGKAKAALLGEYTTVGDYTTVGGAGIFREMGEYTSVGTGGDNGTEWSKDSLHGLDDATRFAPGEGGVLSGGMFR